MRAKRAKGRVKFDLRTPPSPIFDEGVETREGDRKGRNFGQDGGRYVIDAIYITYLADI